MLSNVFGVFTVFSLGTLMLAGCGEKEAPSAKKVAQALSKAENSVERAENSIEAMRGGANALEQKIEQQQVILDALIEKRLILLRQQLGDYQKHLHRLPAPKESELKPALADLQKRFNALAEKFKAYRNAPREKSAEALEQLEAALEDFDSAYQKFDSEIQAG